MKHDDQMVSGGVLGNSQILSNKMKVQYGITHYEIQTEDVTNLNAVLDEFAISILDKKQ